ncbi:MAG: hypothetical protein ACKODE_07850, partial [Acidimicrobiaceae bacterium]
MQLILSFCELGYENNIRKDSLHTPSNDELRLALAFLGNPAGSYWSSTSSGSSNALAMVCDGKTCNEVVKKRSEALNWIVIQAFR